MKKLFLCLITLWSVTAWSATLLFNGSWEAGKDLDPPLEKHTVGPQASITSSTAFKAHGNYSGKFNLPFVKTSTGVSNGNYRTEAWFSGDQKLQSFYYEHEYWISLNYRFEAWQKDKSTEFAPVQIHWRPSAWTNACNKGSQWDLQPFHLSVTNDVMQFTTYGGIPRWRANIIKNQWINMTFHLIASKGNTGLVEAWFNGSKIARVTGANQPKLDFCGGQTRDPYFNVGIYKWDWRSGRQPTQSSLRTLYVDDIRIAEGANGYDLVSTVPQNNDSPPPPPTQEPTPDPGTGGDTGGTIPDNPTPTDPPVVVDPAVDTQPPVISNINVTVTDTTAVVHFNTNEPAFTRLDYGADTQFGSTLEDNELKTSHDFVISGLTVNSPYVYILTAEDAKTNKTTTAVLQFTTGFSFCQ